MRKSDMMRLENGSFFQYETSGKFSVEETWIHPARTLCSHELLFVLDGTVFIEENGVQYELKKNNMLILEPKKYHAGFLPSAPPVSFYWMHFRTDMPMPFKRYAKEEYYDLKYLLKKMLHIANTPSYPRETAETLALMIFYELSHIGNYLQSGKRALVKEIAEYIRINIGGHITVADVAEHFRYNPDYIGKMFKADYGMGLKEYMIAEKIKLAEDMLLTSNLSVKEIAQKLGFDNENLFIKFFMYHEKQSPSGFRNLYFNTHMNNR